MSERQWLPEDLELMAPGPGLAALLAGVDRAKLSGKDRVRLLQARNRLAAHVQGELYADMHAIHRDTPPDQRDDDDPEGLYRWASTEIAFALRWTSWAASVRLEQANRLMADLPAVAAGLRAGEIDVPKALVFCDELAVLERAVARRIVARLIGRAPEWTTGQLRARLRRLVLAADPQAAAKRARARVAGRRVVIGQDPDNLASLAGYELLPHRVAAGWERLTAIAAAAKAAGDPRRMDELRADAMLDLLVGDGIAAGGPVSNGGLRGLPDRRERKPGGDAGPAGDQRTAGSDASAGEQPTATRPADLMAGVAEAGDRDAPWPAAPADPDLLDPAADPPVADRPVAGPPAAGSAVADPPGTGSVREPPPAAEVEGDPSVDPEHERLRPYWLAGFDQLTRERPNGSQPTVRGPMPAPRRGVIDLQLSLDTLLGIDDLPAELAGFGPLLADIARQVFTQRPDLQLRYSVYNEVDALLAHGTTTIRPSATTITQAGRRTNRRPSAAVAAWVRARNRTCFAPGCRTPSSRCDLDHTVAWSEHGESEPDNLGPGCKRHHRLKHSPGCQLVQFHPGVFTSTGIPR